MAKATMQGADPLIQSRALSLQNAQQHVYIQSPTPKLKQQQQSRYYEHFGVQYLPDGHFPM